MFLEKEGELTRAEKDGARCFTIGGLIFRLDSLDLLASNAKFAVRPS
jgi:hypothetical protein